MSEVTTPKIETLQARAVLPRYVRIGAFALLFATVLVGSVIFFLRERPSEFRMKGFPARLSKDVVAVVDSYERRESDGSVLKYFIKADRATTYTDNHQELENVYLEIYDEAGGLDRIKSAKAVYMPQGNRNFTAYFAGSVDILTRDALNIRTEQVTYHKESDTAEADERVEFEREEFKGSSVGALVRIKQQQLELKDQVEFSAVASAGKGELTRNKIESFKGTSRSAFIDQAAGTAALSENVRIYITPTGENESLRQPSQINAATATAFLVEKEVSRIELRGSVELEQIATHRSPRWAKTRSSVGTAFLEGDLARFELEGDAEIRTGVSDSKPTVIRAGYASYEKRPDRFNLRERVSIVTSEGDRASTLKAAQAVYEQRSGGVVLNGDAEVSTDSDVVSAASITAQLDGNRKLRSAAGKGGARATQKSQDRTVDVTGSELTAAFDSEGRLQKAAASGKPIAVLVPVVPEEYSKVTMIPATSVTALFGSGGLLQNVETLGRTTIELNAPGSAADTSDKKLTADSVKTFFSPDGRNMVRADAIGKAELEIVPRNNALENYRTVVSAPSFACEFFPTGNNAKACISGLKTRTVRTPTVESSGRGEQVMTADRLIANFSSGTQNIDTLEASGNAKFTELDRNGTASRMIFSQSNGVVALRDGQPTIWDARGRARGQEIDIDTRKTSSALRGSVSTTYYNTRQLNGAVPFSNTAAPVYVTAASAEFNSSEERAVYSGSARAWQGNNFVKGERLEIFQREQKVVATGTVQSLLFEARSNAKQNPVPVFATSQSMVYEASARRLTYGTGVEIRQGTDRIAGERVVAVLDERGELVQALANEKVVVSQPGRRASGDYAQYDVAQDTVLMRGSPVRVEDSVNGSTEGAEITIALRERRVAGDGRTKVNSSGRIRTVYKVNKNQ